MYTQPKRTGRTTQGDAVKADALGESTIGPKYINMRKGKYHEYPNS